MVPLSDSGNHCTIADYVKFVGINKNKEMVLEKLINNDIDDYEIFNKDWLTDSQIQELGLTAGVIAKLCKGVTKYSKHVLL